MRSRALGAAKPITSTTMKDSPSSPTKKKPSEDEWEVRPGGMLVQKSATPSGRVPTIRVKVKHAAIYHEIYISSQATFGELKKELSSRTGIHPLDMKVIYKDKERESAFFLDAVGVKDKSKVVVLEDPVAQAKRLLEQRRTEKMERAGKKIRDVSVEVDKLAPKVSAIEGIVNKGGRVVENDVVNLIELLMNQLVKLDDIVGADDGEVKIQRRIQVKRVQKYVETLDAIKIKNGQQKGNVQHVNNNQDEQPKLQQHYQKNQPQSKQKQYQHTRSQFQHQQPLIQVEEPVVVANNWELFDSLFMPSTSTPISTPTSATTTAASTASSTPTTRFDWELF